MAYERGIVNVIRRRINEPRRFIQIVIGPRQTGKTTAVAQAVAGYAHPHLSVEATKNESGADWLVFVNNKLDTSLCRHSTLR